MKNPSTLSTVTDVASIAVMTPVVPEVAPVKVPPTSIAMISLRAKVALVNTVEVFTVALAKIVATSTVAPFP